MPLPLTIGSGIALLNASDPALRYTNKVKALGPIAYWSMAELSGSVALDASGNGRNGAYAAVTLGATGIGDGRTAATFNASTAFNNIYSASLNGALNGQEGTLAGWFQVSAAGVWSDAATRVLGTFRVNGSNIVSIQRNGVNNQLDFFYIAGGTTKQVTATVGPGTGWFHVAMTFDKTGDAMKAYVSGAQSGSTQTALGTWSGALDSGQTNLGCRNNAVPDQPWSGNLAHWAIWSTPLSGAQIATLAVVP